MPAEPKIPSAPALVTIRGVELVAAGEWALSTGDAVFTAQDLADAVNAAQCPSVGQPIIKIGHTDPRFNPGDGQPALGRVANMELTSEGSKITGDLQGLPLWLGQIAASAYPQRSIEGVYDFACQIGHVHPFVITGIALLGAVGPGVGVLNDLQDIAALFGVSAAAVISGGHVAAADVISAAGVTTEDVRRAYYDAAPFNLWITEMQLAPDPQLIVCDDATSKTFRVPMTLGGAEDVTFGDPVEVEVEYVDTTKTAASAGERKRLAFASRAESRPVAAGAVAYQKTGTSTGAWTASTATKNLGTADLTAAKLKQVYAWQDPAGDATTKAAYKLPHHFVAADGTPGDASTVACSSAIGVLNGGMGGSGIPDADASAVHAHLAKHLTDAGLDAPELKASAAAAADEPGTAPAAAGAAHAAHTGTHSHSHDAMGSQGGDATHTHEHAHDGDATHGHDHAPSAAAPAQPPAPAPAAPAAEPKGSAVDFTDEQMAGFRAALGKGDADEVTPDEVLQLATSKVAAGSGVKLPSSATIVDRSAWEALNQRVEAQENLEKKRRVNERDDHIKAALKAGKFAATEVEVYERFWNSDPEGAREVLARLRPNVVPTDDIGQAGGIQDDSDSEYAAIFAPAGRR